VGAGTLSAYYHASTSVLDVVANEAATHPIPFWRDEMKTKHVKLNVLTASLMIALGVSYQASAVVAPEFSIDLDGSAGAGTVIVANGMSGTSSEMLVVVSPTTFVGSGWVQFTSLNLNSASVPGSSYFDTGLYMLFDLTAVLTSGDLGLSDSEYNLASLTYTFWSDSGIDNIFTQANATTGTFATVANTTGDALLASGSLIPGTGTAGLSTTFGAIINAAATVENVDADYFFDPEPFYTLALAGFNSTGGAWQFNAATGQLSIGNATGVVDFREVPEPGVLALMGLGLLGLGLARRRV
jgi:hypothetical protein